MVSETERKAVGQAVPDIKVLDLVLQEASPRCGGREVVRHSLTYDSGSLRLRYSFVISGRPPGIEQFL